MSIRGLVGVALVLVTAVSFVAIGPAGASVGELGKVGSFGEGLGEFDFPTDLAVDSSDNSVYVLDEPGGLRPGRSTSFRVQKFAPSLGAPVASVTIATPEVAGRRQYVTGLAVDPALDRLYVLTAIESGPTFPFAASKVLVYSTIPSSGGLVAPSSVPSGVLYDFPVSPEPNAFGLAEGLAVDPHTGDLIVLGSDEADNALVQRINSAGTILGSFDDTTSQLGRPNAGPTGVAVGPDGSVYLSVHRNAAGQEEPGVVKLSSNFSSVSLVHQVEGEVPSLTGGTGTGNGRDFGAQIAVSADGSTVYSGEATVKEKNFEEKRVAGSYEIRGMSTVDGSQLSVFGGAPTTSSTCLITSKFNAVAAGRDGIVYALDEGDTEEDNITPVGFGFDLVKFGPGGSGCPAPTTSFTVNADGASPTVTVQKGATVSFEASSAELNSEEPTELVWEAEGPEKFTTEVKGTPAGLTTTHRFLKPGLYTVTLKMTVTPGSLGSPGTVTRTVEVKAPSPTASFEPSTLSPKPGETVSFDGSESLDPTGSETGGPTHKLKSYKWSFGDGTSETTTAPEYSRSFANASTQSRSETIELVVTNEEDVQSTPTTVALTIQGTPETAPPPKEQPKEVVKEPVKEVPIVKTILPPAKKPLTKSQKLAKALKACKKKPRKQRASCEKQAKKKYGPKPKPKKKSTKK